MKGQNSGLKNEQDIVKAWNGHSISELSPNTQKFFGEMFPDVSANSILRVEPARKRIKPDVVVHINTWREAISIKKGGGNSVHQEKIDSFIRFCVMERGMTEEERESILLFLYGDGTTDGTGLLEERLSGKELITAYESEIKKAQDFLDRNKHALIERFLVSGLNSNDEDSRATYIYHGNNTEGVWCPLNDMAINYLAEMPKGEKSALSVGPFSIQVWNRNLSGSPKMEERRRSIQVKFARCKSYLKKVNDLCLKNQSVFKKQEAAAIHNNDRIAGNNSQGFVNQEKMISLLNGQRIDRLPIALKTIIQIAYPRAASSARVYASKVSGNDVKPRIMLNVEGITRYFTVFMGSGNAVHQETLDGFLAFCHQDLRITKEEENALLTIMYGDGTLDGKSLPENRAKNTKEVKERFSKQNRIAQDFFYKNRKQLIERFLVYGKNGKKKNIKSDFIYYGTDATGRLVELSEAVEFLMKQENSDSALISLGSLTVQPWNRNPSAKPQLEPRRHSLQVKWGGMKKDLAEICEKQETRRGTYSGNWEEYELVSKLNHDKWIGNKLWAVLCNQLELDNIDNIFAVRVSKLANSALSERPVLPKADIYLVRGSIPHQELLNRNYWLDEDMLEDYECQIIRNSGISCKSPQSKDFTYVKLTKNSFTRLFGNPIIGAGISLFVNNTDIELNNDVLTAWDVKEDAMLEFYKPYLTHYLEDEKHITNVEIARIVKTQSIKNLETIIKKNKDIAEKIFFGKTIFEEPYAASFLYSEGSLKPSFFPEFTVTTGSGRHRGIYTIIIKP